MFNIKNLVKSAGLAAGGALLSIATFGSPVYAQDTPKPNPPARVQELEKKAEAELENNAKAKTTEEHLKYLNLARSYYQQAEGVEPGDQFSEPMGAVSEQIKGLEEKLKGERDAAAKAKADGLAKKAEALFRESQKTKIPQEQLPYIQKIIEFYNQAEAMQEGEQYKTNIAYFNAVLANVNKQIEESKKQPQPPAEPPKVEPPKADPSKTEPAKTEPPKTEPPKVEPDKTEPPKVEPPKAEPDKQQPQQKADESINVLLDAGARLGINHATHNDGEHLRLKIGDFFSGKGIYDQKFFQTREGLDFYRRTYAGTARLAIPSLIGITATGDNTEERQQQFITQTISDPSFDIKTDTYARTADANQYLAAMLELGPVFDLSLDFSVFGNMQKLTTHINQVTYVKNKTLPNGDYADGYTADETSKIDTIGWQALLKHNLECKGKAPFNGFIGMLFDYEKTRIEMHGSPIENMLSLHMGLAGKLNIANYVGLTFVGAQQYLDAPGTDLDNWPAVPVFAAGVFALPDVNLAALVNKESQEKFNANVTAFGAVSYLMNRHVSGRLGGVISLGYEKAPIDFLNCYLERIGRNTVGLRRELSDVLAESEIELDNILLPFEIHPPRNWSFLIIGQGGVGRATNLANEEVQTCFGNIGALLRTPYISVGGMGHYMSGPNGIDKGVDVTLQLHKMGNILIYMGGHLKSSPKMKDEIIEAQFGIIARH